MSTTTTVPTQQKKVVLKKNKEIGKIWHEDSRLVFKSDTEKLVIGRYENSVFIPFDKECLIRCSTWKFKYDEDIPIEHLEGDEENEENEEEEEEEDDQVEEEDEGEGGEEEEVRDDDEEEEHTNEDNEGDEEQNKAEDNTTTVKEEIKQNPLAKSDLKTITNLFSTKLSDYFSNLQNDFIALLHLLNHDYPIQI
jgi:hypothetical protein